MFNKTPLESEEQIACVQYLELLKTKGNEVTYTSIPNSTYTKSWKVKKRNKEQGLKAGFPDMVVIINQQLIFVELKRTSGGIVSKVQKDWIEALKNAGQVTKVCKGFAEFKTVVDEYIKTKLTNIYE